MIYIVFREQEVCIATANIEKAVNSFLKEGSSIEVWENEMRIFTYVEPQYPITDFDKMLSIIRDGVMHV